MVRGIDLPCPTCGALVAPHQDVCNKCGCFFGADEPIKRRAPKQEEVKRPLQKVRHRRKK